MSADASHAARIHLDFAEEEGVLGILSLEDVEAFHGAHEWLLGDLGGERILLRLDLLFQDIVLGLDRLFVSGTAARRSSLHRPITRFGKQLRKTSYLRSSRLGLGAIGHANFAHLVLLRTASQRIARTNETEQPALQCNLYSMREDRCSNNDALGRRAHVTRPVRHDRRLVCWEWD